MFLPVSQPGVHIVAICVARTDLHRRLPITELLQLHLRRLLAQPLADGVDELGVRRAGEDGAASHLCCLLSGSLETKVNARIGGKWWE